MSVFNKNLSRLFAIAQKNERLAIGLMSGTSLDGLDIALCGFTGTGTATKVTLVKFETVPYNELFKQQVHEVFALKQADLEKICQLNAYIGKFYSELILETLKKWRVPPDDIDFIASHGQTIYHSPARLHTQTGNLNSTLQIGDGDHIAVKTGIITISDFRQKHVAAGGEGAPLALYGDVLLGSKPGQERILLNIGGIANLTYLPATGDLTKVICTDTGPGNTLIDAACRMFYNMSYDEDSKIAASGKINNDLLKGLILHPFFTQQAPKTTGPELFNLEYTRNAQQATCTAGISHPDLITTLSAFTAYTIASFINKHIAADNINLFVSGGGAKNLFILNLLKQLLPCAVIADTRDIGIDPDAKEAILFALLGNEAIAGQPLQIGNNPAVLMGKFSFPG